MYVYIYMYIYIYIYIYQFHHESVHAFHSRVQQFSYVASYVNLQIFTKKKRKQTTQIHGGET